MFAEPREARIEYSTFTEIAGTPRQLFLTTHFIGKAETVQTRAIYCADGDHLVYCVAPPGQPAPREFATHPGDRLTFVTLRRRR